MCQSTIRKVQDHEVQRIISEVAERAHIAAYIHGLRGVVEQKVQFQMPSTMEQAVKLAVTADTSRWLGVQGRCLPTRTK
jgi:acetaldehyde dehydrogenase (acetylating)